MKINNKELILSGTLGYFYVVLKLKFGVEVQEGLASPLQKKLGLTQMLGVFRVDTSNTYISVSIIA